MNASQKRWLERVADYGCVVSDSSTIQIHHCVGRSAKHNKIEIGHWFILPIHPQYHDVNSNDEFNVTHSKRAFWKEFGTEIELFMNMFTAMIEEEGRNPFPNYDDFPDLKTVGAIMGWVR